MRPKFVDIHCHLDLYPDLKDAIALCDAQRTATLAVTTTPKAFPHNKQLASRSEFVRVALGLHPQLVEERADELEMFEYLLSETRYVGEVGLDAGPRYYRSFELQKKIFRTILNQCAWAGNKILSVHSVRSAKQVLDLIEDCLPIDRGTVILHWFTGSLAEVRRGVQLGCYFSVNEQMLRSSNGCRVLQEIPDDRILTETDGPFIKRSSKPIDPGDVLPVLSEVASLKGVSIEVVKNQVVQNLGTLLDTKK